MERYEDARGVHAPLVVHGVKQVLNAASERAAAESLRTVALWNTGKPMPAGTHVVSLPARLAEPQLTVLGAPDEILIHELADYDGTALDVVHRVRHP